METVQESTPGVIRKWIPLAGGMAGGVLGVFAFEWLLTQDFYALALPGLGMGLGTRLLGRQRFLPLSVTCGILALALGLYSEVRFHPFLADTSFSYFFKHLSDLRPLTWIMILLGGFCGYYFSLSRQKRL